MFTAAEIAEHRSDAESLMTARFAVYAPGGTTVVHGFNVDGYTTKTPTCGKIQGGIARDTTTRYVSVGGVERPVLAGGLHIPVSAPVPVAGEHGVGWEYECTEVSCGVDDPSLVGRRYLVVSAPAKSYLTARRLDVVEIPRPDEEA